MEKRFRVGIVGLSAERGWATTAHIPALRALSDVFEIAGVANTSLASAQAAAAAFDIPRAFESVAELVASPDIDVVVVTVKVPFHKEVVAAALEAGKNVYCEWPLGNGLAEATELARLANETKALAVIGTQAIASPEVQFIRKLVAEGYIGDVLSSTYISAGVSWGEPYRAVTLMPWTPKTARPCCRSLVDMRLRPCKVYWGRSAKLMRYCRSVGKPCAPSKRGRASR